MLHKLAKFHFQTVYFPSYSTHAWTFNDVMTFEYLKSGNLIISGTKIAFEVK